MGDVLVNTIPQLFTNMQYGKTIQEFTETTEWIKTLETRNTFEGQSIQLKNSIDNEPLCKINIPDEGAIQKAIHEWSRLPNKWFDINCRKRAEILYKFGNEIFKDNKLCEVEAIIRGILLKDTKKNSLPLLRDYFHYYAPFSSKYSKKNSSHDPTALCGGIFTNTTPLPLVGAFLSPALAAGYRVILLTDSLLIPAVYSLIDIATKVGIPEGTINIIPGTNDLPSCDPLLDVITVFDDIHKTRYSNSFKKNRANKILNFFSSGIPMIVFDDADLDSACESVIEAAWCAQGTSPWAVNNLLIQENIFDDFIQKLLQRFTSIKIGKANDLNADIACPIISNAEEILAKLVEDAKKSGAEIFQPKNNSSFQPTIIIGGNYFNGNVINENAANIVPIVRGNRFRTIKEAAALANNSRDGLAASVWTENISLANEISDKLQVTNVWVNSHGLFDASQPLSPMKFSGRGYFGGNEGFYEYVNLYGHLYESEELKKSDASVFEKVFTEAQKLQGNWVKLARFERAKQMQLVAQSLSAEIDNLKEFVPEDWLDDWIFTIYDYVSKDFGDKNLEKNGLKLVSCRVPYGVIPIETGPQLKEHDKKLIISAILEGNSVVILHDSENAKIFYQRFASLLPKGVVNVLEITSDFPKAVAIFKELFVSYTDNRYFLTSHNVFTPIRNEGSARDKVTYVKSVWTSVKKSFI